MRLWRASRPEPVPVDPTPEAWRWECRAAALQLENDRLRAELDRTRRALYALQDTVTEVPVLQAEDVA